MKKLMKKIMSKLLIVIVCTFLIGIVCYTDVKAEGEIPEEQPPVEEIQEEQDEPKIIEKIETVIVEKAYEVKDWIVAFVVAFLSSGAFLTLAMSVIKLISNKIKSKIDTLEKNAQLSKEQAEQAKHQLEELSQKVETEYLPALEKYVKLIEQYVKVEEGKTERVNKLLDKLVTPGLIEAKEGNNEE